MNECQATLFIRQSMRVYLCRFIIKATIQPELLERGRLLVRNERDGAGEAGGLHGSKTWSFLLLVLLLSEGCKEDGGDHASDSWHDNT